MYIYNVCIDISGHLLASMAALINIYLKSHLIINFFNIHILTFKKFQHPCKKVVK
jgi:nitrate reductase gamma subunit